VSDKAKLGEYLRRNLIHASAVGIAAGADAALKRLAVMKRPPKWIVESFTGIADRASKVHPEIAAHRDELTPTLTPSPTPAEEE